MKKITILILTVLMLCGCSQRKLNTTFMITRDNILYALYNQDGEKLTDYLYKTFEEIEGVGYIVTNEKDQKGFISIEGKEMIAFGEYETIESVDQMLYATKKVEKKEEKKEEKKDNKKEDKKVTQETKKEEAKPTYIKENLYVLNNKGEVLYSASQDISILKSGLPVILENGEYKVLYRDGEVLETTKDVVYSADQSHYSRNVVISYENKTMFYDLVKDEKEPEMIQYDGQGQYKIMAMDDSMDQSALLYDSSLQSFIYVDRESDKTYQMNLKLTEAYYDDSHNIVLKDGQKVMLYKLGREPKVMTSYYKSVDNYLERSQVVYGPHIVYKDGVSSGEIQNCQLYPAPFYIHSDIFPVYVKKKGFQYYNFDNKKVIDQTYLDAEPFDINSRAIVKIDGKDGYSLIDDTGKVVTKKDYSQIKYIGSSYYAVYNSDGRYGIVDAGGNEIFPVEYTTLIDNPIVHYDDSDYMILGKNGRSFVYDIQDDMEVIFSVEGQAILDQKGYFIVGNTYYTFDGEEIK